MWRSYAKDGLMVLFTISILLFSPASSFLIRNEPVKGFLFFVMACALLMISIVISAYWQKCDIHATAFGVIASLIIFIAGVSLLWWLKFNFWLPIVLFVLFAAFIAGTYIMGKKIKSV